MIIDETIVPKFIKIQNQAMSFAASSKIVDLILINKYRTILSKDLVERHPIESSLGKYNRTSKQIKEVPQELSPSEIRLSGQTRPKCFLCQQQIQLDFPNYIRSSPKEVYGSCDCLYSDVPPQPSLHLDFEQ